jgi:hypothetical protein
MHVDDGLGDTCGGQHVEAPVEQRLARDFDQRFWQRIGDRAHALAKPRREHHGGVGLQLGTLSSNPCRR